MSKLLRLFLILCVGFSNAAITRSLNDIRAFEDFLRNTINGKQQEPATPELKLLQNAWENSGKFEGDILLTEEQINELVDEYANYRNGLNNPSKLWPNRVVPYEITTADFTPEQVSAIENGIAEINRVSCLSVQRRNGESNYIRVGGRGGGCYAYVGVIGGGQELNLQPSSVGSGCFRHGTIVHEFLHAIGFYHMQSTHDRDDWVRIVWEKIQPGSEHNFNKYSSSEVTNVGQNYDYGSVMHYSEYGFSVDGSKTIIPLQPTSEVIGQRNGMSQIDINRLNRLYNC